MKILKKSLAVFLAIITIITTVSIVVPVFAEGNVFTSAEDESCENGGMTSKIVSEITELRDEYEKHFVCEDGSYIVATYNDPVHYKESGKWKEIDNTLKLSDNAEDASKKGMYAPKAGTADIKIPQSFSNGKKVSATNKGYTMSFSVDKKNEAQLNKSAIVVDNVEKLTSNVGLSKASENETETKKSTESKDSIEEYNNKAMAVKNQAGAVVYEEIFSNADLEYIVTANSMKENIVINKKQDKYVYSFDMDFGELVPVINEDNSISLVNPKDKNETVFYIESPYMYDANKNESTDIKMTLTENKDGTYILTVKANAEWVNSLERVFPVVIDPTVYWSFDDVFVMDGALNKNTTKINKELRVGRNLNNLTRTYMKPIVPLNIPDNSQISGAYLTLKKDFYFQSISGNDISVLAYDCYDVSTWAPTNVTWDNQPYNNSDNGYRSGHTYLTSEAANSSKTTYQFNITDAFLRWRNGGVNNGIMLASSDESTKTQIDFHSSRASDSNNYPKMYVTYIVPSLNLSNIEIGSSAVRRSFRINTAYSWSASTDANWLTLEDSYGYPSNNFSLNKIIVTENTSVNDRTGTVTVTSNGTVIGTITVTQHGANPYITINTDTLNFEAGNNSQTVSIESNTVWSFDNLSDWITVNPSTGSNNSTVEIEVSENCTSSARTYALTVTADTANTTINVSQSRDDILPATPNLYEEDGLLYMSLYSIGFDALRNSSEHIEYKLGNGEWTNYENEPLSIIRSYDVSVSARTCDAAGNTSAITSLVLNQNLGEYTASYNDIAFGEGVLPIGFERTYSSKSGWFFTFEANVQEYTNGYVFTDFYGNKHYYIINDEGKYVSAYGDELKVEEDTLLDTNYSYVVPYGELECYFNENGKLAIVKDNYNAATYSWANNNIYITDTASNTNIVRLNNGKPTHITASRFDSETNSTLSKNVQYEWTSGRLTTFTDAGNNEHYYSYTNGRLSSNEGEVVAYSSDGRVKRITQPNGAFVKYTYNDTAASSNEETPGNIGAVTVSDSRGVTDIWYYSDGISISNSIYSNSDNATYTPNNISRTITTDTVSQIAYAITVPADESEEIVYEEYPLYEEDGDGNFTFYLYNNKNNVTATLFVEAGALEVTDSTTFEQAEAVAKNKTTYTYNTKGNVTSEVYQERIDNSFVNKERTTYSYNSKESVTIEVTYQWLNNRWYQTHRERYTYDDYGNVLTDTSTVYTNTENSETGAIDVSYDITTVDYEYDAWCQLITVIKSDTEGFETVTEKVYDNLGRIVSSTEDDKTTSYTYDTKGNVLTVTENGKTNTFTYSNNGNLISRTYPDGAVVNYTYDSYGNLTGQSFNGYSFTYNTLGSILTASSASGQLVNYTYSQDVKQDALTSNFGNGQSIVYTYNDDGKLTAIKLGETTKYGYEYFETTDDNGEVTAEWAKLTDYVSNLEKIIESSKTTVKDRNGNFIYSVESVYADDEVENSYNGVITTVGNTVYTLVAEDNKDIFKVNGNTAFTKEYTYEHSNLTNVETAGITTSYDYNADKLISSLENTLNNVSKVYSYTYDDNGNITSETVATKDANGNIVSSETVTYNYDDNEQLLSAETSTLKYVYTYDDRGNILTKKEYSVTVDGNGEKVYTLVDGSTDTYTYDTVWEDKLVSYNGQTITYDAVGNPTNYMGDTLSWTMGRQLAAFGNITYTYNEDGIRTSKTSNNVTTKYYLDGANIIEQTDGTTTLYFYYDSIGELVGFKYNGNNYVYVKNLMGDIVGIADISGNLIASYTYNAWGKVTSVTGSNTTIGELNPFRYRSYYYDSDIQMYYLQSRYYDPEIGRFINADEPSYVIRDDASASGNIFAYCRDNPVNRIDKYGTMSAKAFLALVSLAMVAYDSLLCVRLYVWGFNHRKKNQTYDFSESWEKLIVKRLKSSKAMEAVIKKMKKKFTSNSKIVGYGSPYSINFYDYAKKSIADIDLTLAIGGGGDFYITLYKQKKGYKVEVTLRTEKFNFEFWKMKIGKLTFGVEEPHSKSYIVTLINNFGYLTQKVNAFVWFNWVFNVSYTI